MLSVCSILQVIFIPYYIACYVAHFMFIARGADGTDYHNLFPAPDLNQSRTNLLVVPMASMCISPLVLAASTAWLSKSFSCTSW